MKRFAIVAVVAVAGIVAVVVLVGSMLSTASTSTRDSATKSVAGAEVAKQLQANYATRFGAVFGQAPESVSCAKDLPSTMGANVECTAVVKGSAKKLEVAVTGLDGDDVTYDFAQIGE